MKSILQKRWLRFIPAMVLGGILLLLYRSMSLPENEAPSDQSYFPAFTLKDVRSSEKLVSLDNVKGQLSIVHVWATWCGACVKEHSEWIQIHRKWPYPLIGIVYRDDANKVNYLIKDKGDPYQYLMNDETGSLGLNLGLMGTPETFIVDKKGMIRFHLYGPVSVSRFEKEVLPVLEQISQENA
ncbi:MAG: redoxin family protein [Candidatus Berkiella sp.]